MGSRRAKRGFGKTQSIKDKKHGVATGKIGKAKTKALRAQQKAAILANARDVREEAKRKPPTLISVISLGDASTEQLHEISSILTSTGSESSTKIETYCVPALNVHEQEHEPKIRERLLATLDIAKVADLILLVFFGQNEMRLDVAGLVNAVREQGLPSVYSVAIGTGSEDADLRKLRGRQLAAESLGEDHVLRPIQMILDDDAKEAKEINKLALRRMTTKAPREISWRARYGYLLADGASGEKIDSKNSSLTLTGWVRGRGFSSNELIHVTGFGSFAATRITDAKTGEELSRRDEANAEPVESECEVDETMNEQTWPPEVDDVEEEEEDPEKRLAEQFDKELDKEEQDEKSDEDGMEMDDTNDLMENVEEGANDDNSVDQDEVQRIRDQSKTDENFPDEIDTPMNQPARKRFARYRGLKSLRTGEWDPKELLPREYASLFQFRNLASTRKRTLAEAQKEMQEAETTMNNNFVSRGRKVNIHLSNVPTSIAHEIAKKVLERKLPVIVSGMLRHENRRSVVHFNVQRVDDAVLGGKVKAKEHLEMHCGFVRFTGRPMFSEHNANSDKHKMERYLRHGRHTVVTFYGPAIYAPAPAILCHPNGGMIAAGSALGADPDRIMLKRIIITGYPFRSQKKRAVVRFMFFNAEDIRWFKPVELWTKMGRSGHILEPVGTHGHMKCIFDNVIMHHDTVCMTLYKRVYPKLAPDDEKDIPCLL